MTDRVVLGPHRLECAFLGARTGPRLVFLHEGLGSLGLWRDFPQRLATAAGIGAFVYSRPNYGTSEPSAPPPRPVRYMHEEAELLARLLPAVAIDDPILVGHSDGASIALLYAGTGARVRALVLEAPHVFTEPGGLASIARARDSYAEGPLRARLARHHTHVDAAFHGWNGAWLHPDFARWNIEGVLPAIRAPLLLVQGDDDEYGTAAQLDAIRRGAAHAQVRTVLLPHCGHAPHSDQPEAVLQVMTAFVRAALGREGQ